MDQEANRTSWIWTAVAGTVAVGLAAVGMNGDPARSQEDGKPGHTPLSEAAAPAPARAENRQRADPSFERYRSLLRRNPFAPRLPLPTVEVTPVTSDPPELPPPGGAPAEKPKEEKKPDAAAPAPPPAPPDPLKDWTYTGTVIIGGDVYAVLENKASKRGEYVKTGGSFEGGTVEVIAQNELRLHLGGGVRALPKSSAFNATPLNAPAGAPGGAPGTAGPGGPGGPGGPAGPAAPGGPGGRPGGPMPGAASPGARPAGAVPASAAPVAAPVEATRVPR